MINPPTSIVPFTAPFVAANRLEWDGQESFVYKC